jgi:glycosyltransferase involved in cell wall biosynthesis
MTASPRVTVVIPTRNRPTFLGTALSAALRQEEVDLDVVVVDDASTDSPSATLAAFSDPRVRLSRHEERRGVAAARNTGIANASGDWVAFLDDDDVWSPRKLRAQLDEAATQGAEFAYAAAILLDEMKTALAVFPAPDPDDLPRLLLQNYVIPAGSSNVVAKTDLLRRLGGFDEALHQLADWDLWLRLALAARPARCNEVLVGYLEHRGNMLLEDRTDVMAEFDYLVAKHRSANRAYDVEFDRAAFSRWVAGGHRRAGRRLRAARVYGRSAITSGDGGSALRALAVLLGEQVLKARKKWSRGGAPAPPGWLNLYR